MDIRDWLALLGVMTGLVGAIAVAFSSGVTWLEYRRGGSIVKIKGRRGWTLMNAAPPYKENQPYTSVTVYNRGRRPTIINQVGEAFLFKSGGGIYSDSMIYGPRNLEEEGATDFLAEEKVGKKRPAVGYFYANTRSGRSYRYYPNTRVVYWLSLPIRKSHRLYKKITDKKAKSKRD